MGGLNDITFSLFWHHVGDNFAPQADRRDQVTYRVISHRLVLG